MNRTQIEVSGALVKGERNYLPLGMNTTTNETEDSVETRRRMLEDRLLGELIFKVSDEEWKGLTLLVRALEDSPRCRVTERGSIIVRFDDEIDDGLTLRVECLQYGRAAVEIRPRLALRPVQVNHPPRKLLRGD